MSNVSTERDIGEGVRGKIRDSLLSELRRVTVDVAGGNISDAISILGIAFVEVHSACLLDGDTLEGALADFKSTVNELRDAYKAIYAKAQEQRKAEAN